MNQKVFYVDAACGGGKTTAAVGDAIDKAERGERVLMAFPSIQLVAETHRRLTEAAGDRSRVHRFDSDTQRPGQVKNALVEHLKHFGDGGQIVLTTHASFLTLPYFHQREDWHVVIDEIPAGHEGFQLNLAEEHRVLTDHIAVVEDGLSNPIYHSVYATPGGQTRLAAYVENPRQDEVWQYVSPVVERILHPDWHVVVETSSYYGILDHDGLEGRDSLLIYADLKPSVLAGFRSATIMGAWFERSILYRLWLRQGVEFEVHDGISSRLLFRQHTNGSRLRLLWGFDGFWSKRAKDREVELLDGSKTTMWNALVATTRQRFADLGKPVLFVDNKDRQNALAHAFMGLDATPIPHSPYGHNQYQDRHVIAILPALNPPPHEFGYLESFGINAEDVRGWVYQQWVYQAMNRTSLRNRDATEPVTVVVADRDTAEKIAEVYPGCTVEPLGIPLKAEPEPNRGGRPRKVQVLSGAERERRRRERIAISRAEVELLNSEAAGHMDLLQPLRGDVVTKTTKGSIGGFRHDMVGVVAGTSPVADLLGSASIQAGLRGIEVSVFASIYSTERERTTVADAESFIAQLKACHRQTVDSKQANVLANTTVFDPDLDPETDRGLRNIVHIWGIWLDIDDGQMPPDVIPKLLPTTRMVVYNSYSGGNSYRVFIPTQQRMHVRSYREVVQQIVQIVEAAGYVGAKHPDTNRPRHGIDASKFTPCSLFYLPCLARNPADSFFHDYNQARRRLLNVEAWIERSILREPEEFAWIPNEVEAEVLRQQAVEAVGDRRAELVHRYAGEYQGIPDGAGRHQGFFRLAWKLHYVCGIGLSDLDWYMRSADTVPHHTDADLKSIQKSLASERYAPVWRSMRNAA
ncbi:DEAD/DEAH box helicase [Azospirillum argentinense]